MIEPEKVSDLEDPAFLAWLRARYGLGPVRPDTQDYDLSASAKTVEARAHQYRLAQARKIIRLWRQWKAEGN